MNTVRERPLFAADCAAFNQSRGDETLEPPQSAAPAFGADRINQLTQPPAGTSLDNAGTGIFGQIFSFVQQLFSAFGNATASPMGDLGGNIPGQQPAPVQEPIVVRPPLKTLL